MKRPVIVKCKICGETFEKQTDTPKVGMRYFHPECYEIYLDEVNKSKMLIDSIGVMYDNWNLEPNWNKISRQLGVMLDEGFTFETLASRLLTFNNSSWFDLRKANGGIGFLRCEPFEETIISKEEAISRLASYLANIGE